MKPLVLAILDGWGISFSPQNNAITQAKIPNIKTAEKNYPGCSLQASGIAAGLPWNEAGNSEVGHLNIGAGRIVYQYLPRISLEIKDGKFFKNQALNQAMDHANKNNSTLHLMGLVSSGNVHSYLDHIYALLEMAQEKKVKKLNLHVFTDGKDAPLKEGKKILDKLQKKLKNPNWKIATLIGRFFAMDRNSNWTRTEKTYNLLTQGQGEKTQNPIKKLEELYEKEIIDTYIEPIVVVDKNQEPIGNIKDEDSIIFFNFREDSARQLTKAFVLENFKKFPKKSLKKIFFCSMTQYEKNLIVDAIAYPPIEIENHLIEILSKAKKEILKVAETEKYAHVTYFFNGGKERPYPGEVHKLIKSKVISHYDESPEMQADKVTDEVVKGIKEKYDLIVVNYANPDMIAHTGNFEAAIKAVESIDKQMGRLISMAGYDECVLMLTSDHGNVEEMVNLKTGEKITEHSINPVPFYLMGADYKLEKPKNETQIRDIMSEPQGLLADIAPTILELLNVPKPPAITGRSLLGFLK